MRKKKLWPAAAVLSLNLIVPCVGHADDAAPGQFRGTGVTRVDEETCNQHLPGFTQRLRDLGLQLAEPAECVPVEGDAEAFAPAFRALASKPMRAETAVTAVVPTESDCKDNLRNLMSSVAESDEVVVEAACTRLTVADAESGEATEQYQAMAFLLKTQQ